ncbi:hypothetical protein BH09BAC5_BH09BAC5_25860 [soil metagenome]
MVHKSPGLLQKFLSMGIALHTHELEKRRIRLLNFFYLLATFTFLIATTETFLNEGVNDGLLLLVSALLFQFGAIPLFSGKRKIAEFYFILVGNLSILFFDNYFGKDAGTYLYYFPFVIFIAFLVDFRKLFFVFLHLGMSLVFIIISFLIEHKYFYKAFPPEALHISFIANFIVATVMMSSVAVIIVLMMHGQYDEFNRRMEEREVQEKSMKHSIKEKETLLAEVHHRVKNNLAVISSLLNLQMNLVKNEYTREVLRESRNRVASMALIHQKLYQHENIERIDFGLYASELIDEIKKSYPENTTSDIQVILDVEHIPLSLTMAVPAGLLLNELLSNCYKHAFSGRKAGNITIHFNKSGENCMLEVADNGVGLSGDFKIENQSSLGMTIIQSLSEQLDGTIKISGTSGVGTNIKVEFRP